MREPAFLKGVVHGKTIELDQHTGLPDGQCVAVSIATMSEPASTSAQMAAPSVESWSELLIFDSTVRPGQRIVKGTRLSAEDLVAELETGRTEIEILHAHPELTKQHVEAIRHYALVPIAVRQSFGAWAEDAEELDQLIERNRQRRKKVDEP